MAGYAEANEIGYAIASDVGGATVSAFAVDSFPDYYVIDRAGKLRFADLANAELERAIETLLAEDAGGHDPALNKAIAAAQRKDKRILAIWGTEERRASFASAQRGDREFAKLLRNEYEQVALDRTAHADLAEKARVGATGFVLTVLDRDLTPLASLDASEASPTRVREFLEANRVPVKDAEVLWASALDQAEREQKRVLVHLGAPW